MTLKGVDMKVFIVEWEEYEKGWGARPDGYSASISLEERKRFSNEYSTGVGIHTSMPIRMFEVEDSSLYKKAKEAGGTIHLRRLPEEYCY